MNDLYDEFENKLSEVVCNYLSAWEESATHFDFFIGSELYPSKVSQMVEELRTVRRDFITSYTTLCASFSYVEEQKRREVLQGLFSLHERLINGGLRTLRVIADIYSENLAEEGLDHPYREELAALSSLTPRQFITYSLGEPHNRTKDSHRNDITISQRSAVSYDKLGRAYTALHVDQITESLGIELDLLHTSIPMEPIKIFIRGRLVYDSVNYFYELKNDHSSEEQGS